MTIASEITRIKGNIADAYDAAEAKGATMPVTENSDNLAATIATIETGIEPTGTIYITANGTYNVTDYATAEVTVEGAPEYYDLITQDGDNVVTDAGVNIAYQDGATINTLEGTTEYKDAYTFCDNDDATEKFSLLALKKYFKGDEEATYLNKYDRVDGVATVAGFYTDFSGKRYAVCVLDAEYRTDIAEQWSTSYITPFNLLDTDGTSAISANMVYNYANDNNLLTDFNALNYTLSKSSVNYLGLLPNPEELSMIFNDRAALDMYDSTIQDYPTQSLTALFQSNKSFWSCTNVSDTSVNVYKTNNLGYRSLKDELSSLHIIPIFEISVDIDGKIL